MYLNEIYCSGDIICEGGLKVRRILTTEGEIPHIDGTAHKDRLVRFLSEGESILANSNIGVGLNADGNAAVCTVYGNDDGSAIKSLHIMFNSLSSESLKITGNNSSVVLSLLNSTITANSAGNTVFGSDNSMIEAASTKDIALSNGVWVFV